MVSPLRRCATAGAWSWCSRAWRARPIGRAATSGRSGLVAVAEFDLVAAVFGLEFGETNAATRIVYGLVGLAGVYGIGALVARRRAGAARPLSPSAAR